MRFLTSPAASAVLIVRITMDEIVRKEECAFKVRWLPRTGQGYSVVLAENPSLLDKSQHEIGLHRRPGIQA